MGVSFHRFRDTVVAQTAAVLMNRGSARPVKAVDAEEPTEQIIMKLTTAEPDERDQLLEKLMAIRSGRPAGPRGRTRKRGGPPRRATRPALPALAVNAGHGDAPTARRRMHP